MLDAAMVVDLNSEVRAVTVYRRGALVTRVATLACGAEGFPRRVQLVGLPLALADGSARIEVTSDTDARAPVVGDLRVGLAAPGHDLRLAPPTDEELDRARLALAEIQAELGVVEAALARLAKLQPLARGAAAEGQAPAPSPTAARLALLSFRRERSEALARRLEVERERARVARERVAELEERRRLASSQRNVRSHELRKAAILELEAPSDSGAAERITITLHYFVPGARWTPSYTLRLDHGMRTASLELRALVGQATGEDWRGVALTLSTAHPQHWTELPKLDSRRIGRRQPPPARTGWRPPPSGAEALYADYDRGLGSPSAAVDEPEPEPEHERFDLAALLQQESGAPPVQAPFGPPPNMSMPPGMPMPQGMPPGGPPMPPPSMPMAPPAARSAEELPSFGGGGLGGLQPEPMLMPSRAQAKSRGRVVGALVDGAVGAVGAAAAAFGGSGRSHDGPAPPPEPEPELSASEELLDYGRLRMFDAGDLRRGRLRRQSDRAAYAQRSQAGIEVDAAFAQVLAAVAAAQELDRCEPPEGHAWPSSEAGFDYAYVADGPTEVHSDGRFHAILVDARPAAVAPRYVTVPRETQDVFRIVRLDNPLAAPLLPGPADVYVGGKYALTTPLGLTPVRGRLELGLGVEQAIKIARNVTYTEDSSGMFKRSLELRHTIAVEVANHLPAPATVEVRERVPVAAEHADDDIRVEVAEVRPAWEDWEPEDQHPPLRGGHRWIVEVAAGGRRELEATWTVTIPSNHELHGGNRREA